MSADHPEILRWVTIPARGRIQPATAHASADKQFLIEPGWAIDSRGGTQRTGWEVVRGLVGQPWFLYLSEAKAACAKAFEGADHG